MLRGPSGGAARKEKTGEKPKSCRCQLWGSGWEVGSWCVVCCVFVFFVLRFVLHPASSRAAAGRQVSSAALLFAPLSHTHLVAEAVVVPAPRLEARELGDVDEAGVEPPYAVGGRPRHLAAPAVVVVVRGGGVVVGASLCWCWRSVCGH